MADFANYENITIFSAFSIAHMQFEQNVMKDQFLKLNQKLLQLVAPTTKVQQLPMPNTKSIHNNHLPLTAIQDNRQNIIQNCGDDKTMEICDKKYDEINKNNNHNNNNNTLINKQQHLQTIKAVHTTTRTSTTTTTTATIRTTTESLEIIKQQQPLHDLRHQDSKRKRNPPFLGPKEKSQIQFLMIAALTYILSPIDLIPEMIFGIFGILDDLLFLILCLFGVAIILIYPIFRQLRRTLIDKLGLRMLTVYIE